jgi:nucleoside-diphosphate kinase
MSIERTVVIIKPDAVAKSQVDAIRARYIKAGLEIEHTIQTKLHRVHAEELYSQHKGKHFFAGLVLAMSSGGIMALLVRGEDAVEKVRALNGPTDPRQAAEGTIRRDFMSAGGPFNTVHGSDSQEEAYREWLLLLQADHDDYWRDMGGPPDVSRPTKAW